MPFTNACCETLVFTSKILSRLDDQPTDSHAAVNNLLNMKIIGPELYGHRGWLYIALGSVVYQPSCFCRLRDKK
jgi:hypothetical protein